MQFTAKQADILKAIKSLQSQAARENQLSNVSDIRVRSIGVDRLELFAADRKITIDAEIAQPGAVSLPIIRLSEITRAGESAQFRSLAGGQMQVDCGGQTYYLSASGYAPESSAPKTAAAVVTEKSSKVRNSMLISAVAHIILAFVIFLLAVDDSEIIEDSISVDMVKPVPKTRRPKKIKPKPPKPVRPAVKPIAQPVRVSAAPRIA